jgi:DNA-binding NtrC family response regulator
MILIVDDEERILFVLEQALAKLNNDCEVETASTGKDALQMARERRYDLVISDLIMPDMDGVEFTEKVMDLRPDTAVVWMTAYGCHSFQGEADRLGVYSCVEKPLEIRGFRDLARRAMALDNGSVGSASVKREQKGM